MLLMTWEVMILNANLAMNMNKGRICIKSHNVFPSYISILNGSQHVITYDGKIQRPSLCFMIQ